MRDTCSRAKYFVEIQFGDETAMRQAMQVIVERFPRIDIDDNTVKRFSLLFPKHYLSRIRKLSGVATFKIVHPENPGNRSFGTWGRGVLPKYDDLDWLTQEAERLEAENEQLRSAR